MKKRESDTNMCRGCGDEFKKRRLLYGLCDACRQLPYGSRPLNIERRNPDGSYGFRTVAVCDCGRDYLTLTVEEMSQPCPHPRYKEVRYGHPKDRTA